MLISSPVLCTDVNISSVSWYHSGNMSQSCGQMIVSNNRPSRQKVHSLFLQLQESRVERSGNYRYQPMWALVLHLLYHRSLLRVKTTDAISREGEPTLWGIEKTPAGLWKHFGFPFPEMRREEKWQTDSKTICRHSRTRTKRHLWHFFAHNVTFKVHSCLINANCTSPPLPKSLLSFLKEHIS